MILLTFNFAEALAFNVEVPGRVKQGEIKIVSVEGVKFVEGEFLQEKLKFYKVKNGNFKAFLASDISTQEGGKELILTGKKNNGKRFKISKKVTITSGNFNDEHLIISGKTEMPDEEDLQRIRREASVLKELWISSSNEKFFQGDFIKPVENGQFSPNFGFKRVINSVEKSPHTGVDIGSPEGTTVMAVNDGVVMLAHDLFFSGNSIIIDHGAGLISMYFHLSELSVRAGQNVKKGDAIGKVGMTGRATGPHLHFGMRLGNFRVNPQDLIKF